MEKTALITDKRLAELSSLNQDLTEKLAAMQTKLTATTDDMHNCIANEQVLKLQNEEIRRDNDILRVSNSLLIDMSN